MWYYPAKRYQSSELLFVVTLFTPHVLCDTVGKYLRTLLPYVEYPIVGVKKDRLYENGIGVDAWCIMLNDGTRIHVKLDDCDIIGRELGNSWGTVHDISYFANAFNAKAKREAYDACKPAYQFGTADLVKGKPVFTPLFTLPTRPQRNDAWYLPVDKLDAKREAEKERIRELTVLGEQAANYNRRFA